MISILILTYNEEKNIKRCLASVAWSDDVVVLDSFSVDKTQEIISSQNVRFYQREFDDYASQRNYGLHEIEFKYPWVMMLDADETVTDELKREIGQRVNTDKDVVMYRMRRKDHLFGKWIKHASGYPTWFGRLVRPKKVRVLRAINEEYHADGDIEYLDEHIMHYPFNKGIKEWVDKHNRYSSMEAELLYKDNQKKEPLGIAASLDPVKRRNGIKKFVNRLPGRPFIVFFGFYIWRRGFLDGKEGLLFCLLRFCYELMIDSKLKELRRRDRGLLV